MIYIWKKWSVIFGKCNVSHHFILKQNLKRYKCYSWFLSFSFSFWRNYLLLLVSVTEYIPSLQLCLMTFILNHRDKAPLNLTLEWVVTLIIIHSFIHSILNRAHTNVLICHRERYNLYSVQITQRFTHFCFCYFCFLHGGWNSLWTEEEVHWNLQLNVCSDGRSMTVQVCCWMRTRKEHSSRSQECCNS